VTRPVHQVVLIRPYYVAGDHRSFEVSVPQGAYFVATDVRPSGYEDGVF
jgi:hypothetical protein